MQHGTWNPEDIGDKTSDIRQSDMESDKKIRRENYWTKKSDKKLDQIGQKWDKKKSGKKYQTKNGQQIR